MSLLHNLAKRAQFGTLRLRHDWWYRWAHDPLCERLGGGVLTIGRLRICRSCTAMYSGIAVGGAAALTAPMIGRAALAPAVWIGAASGLAVASTPDTYASLSRGTKDGIRSGTGVGGGLLLAFFRARRWGWATMLTAIAAGGYRVLTQARAQAKAHACDGCPELDGQVICSGFAQQAVALRAYEQQASELAMRTYRPPARQSTS